MSAKKFFFGSVLLLVLGALFGGAIANIAFWAWKWLR